MPDIRDYLPPPPWEGPPIPEAFLRTYNLTPERIQLIQEINTQIRRRTTYGLRQEIIQREPANMLSWSNGSASWNLSYLPKVVTLPLPELEEERIRIITSMSSKEYKRAFRKARVGDSVELDANEVLVYGTRENLEAILKWLEPLPLYAYSFESKQRGIYNPLGHIRMLFEQWRSRGLEE